MATVGVLHRGDFGDVPGDRGYEREDTDDEEDESEPVVPYDAEHGSDRSRLVGDVAIPGDVIAETLLDALQQGRWDRIFMGRASNKLLELGMKLECLLAVHTAGEMGGEFCERLLFQFIIEETIEILQCFGAVGHELVSLSDR